MSTFKNAWDHVPPPNDQDEIITAALAKQKTAPVPEDEKTKYNDKPAKNWDNFYKANQSNFFKTRKWLHLEFPELVRAAEPDAGPITIAEIGCGTGSASFPLLAANKNPNLTLKAYDYSTHAIKLVQNNELYKAPPTGTIEASVWDLSSLTLPANLAESSIDIVVLIFVLSALHPREWHQAVSNIHRILKPGGLVVLRDYGRYDLTQLRFKGGRLLEDNFYIRGDKTRVYFFELDELALLFTGARVPALFKRTDTEEVTVEEEDGEQDPSSAPSLSPSGTHTPAPAVDSAPSPTPASPDPIPDLPSSAAPKQPVIHPSLLAPSEDTQPLFGIEQLGVDRRLIVNRKRKLKMYRVWMQAKFRKLP
ncbi:hypothetical protein EIP86_001157 [Pleurotus ostreatoroseus]|nr:hypothetical protein EIP86_001157 [Pleurotus ostreatoroseus]